MKNLNFLKILITTLILTITFSPKSWAEISSFSWNSDRTQTTYTNEDGSYLKLMSYTNSSFDPNYKYYHYFIGYQYDSNNNYLAWKINADFNARVYDAQGNVIGVTNRFANSMNSNYQTLNYKENGQLISRQDKDGNIMETYKYDNNGKLLVYNSEGKLTGAFDNFFNRLASTDPFYKENMSLLDENGSYQEKDNKGRVIGLYKENGDIITYRYDKGGNLIKAVENGVTIYQRRIYTPSEATAAVQNNKNKFSIIYR